jgi:hypothetical protein
LATAGFHGSTLRIGGGDVNVRGSGRSSANRHAVDKSLGHNLKIDGREDPGAVPVIGTTLGAIDGVIHRIVVDIDLKLVVLASGLEEPGENVMSIDSSFVSRQLRLNRERSQSDLCMNGANPIHFVRRCISPDWVQRGRLQRRFVMAQLGSC